MTTLARLLVVFIAANLQPLIALYAQPPAAPAPKWYKGNTHSHSWNTDADIPPDEVARWYREQKYNFLVLTDHDSVTDVAPLNALLAPSRLVGSTAGLPYTPFLVLSGEEVTDHYSPNGPRRRARSRAEADSRDGHEPAGAGRASRRQ
jgi:hypothetical protein